MPVVSTPKLWFIEGYGSGAPGGAAVREVRRCEGGAVVVKPGWGAVWVWRCEGGDASQPSQGGLVAGFVQVSSDSPLGGGGCILPGTH